MGQKVHPIGVRLGITQASQSNWYAKGARYSFFLREDKYLRGYLFQTCRHCIISKIEIERRRTSVRIRLSAARIIPLVGVEGKSLEKFRQDLQQKCQRFRRRFFRSLVSPRVNEITESLSIQIFVRQLSCPEADAQYLAGFIVTELEKRAPFRRILRMTQERARNSNRGLRLQISGRLNGSEIARSEWVRRGCVPLHTFSIDLDYAYKTARTIYGLLGVKVWISRILIKVVFNFIWYFPLFANICLILFLAFGYAGSKTN
jgi:small subunit ribosomal protein S3